MQGAGGVEVLAGEGVELGFGDGFVVGAAGARPFYAPGLFLGGAEHGGEPVGVGALAFLQAGEKWLTGADEFVVFHSVGGQIRGGGEYGFAHGFDFGRIRQHLGKDETTFTVGLAGGVAGLRAVAAAQLFAHGGAQAVG